MTDKNKTYRWVGKQLTILNDKATTGFGTEVDVSQFRHIGIAIIGASSPDLTVKCQGSYLGVADIDFSAAQAKANSWDYVGMYDMQTGLFIAGDTGIAFTGSADVRLFVINADALRSLCFHVTARVAGNVTVYAFPVNNQ